PLRGPVLIVTAIPVGGLLDRLLQAPARQPAEQGLGFVDGEAEELCLVGRARVVLVLPAAVAPAPDEKLHHALHRLGVLEARTEVPWTADIAPGRQPRSQQQVAAQWFEDMLPGADRLRIAHGDWPARGQRLHAVGD